MVDRVIKNLVFFKMTHVCLAIIENFYIYYNDNVLNDEWLYASFFPLSFFLCFCEKMLTLAIFSSLSTFL